MGRTISGSDQISVSTRCEIAPVEPNEDLFQNASDYVVVVGLGDFGAVEGTGDEGFVGAEVVDEDFAVDLGVVEVCRRRDS